MDTHRQRLKRAVSEVCVCLFVQPHSCVLHAHRHTCQMYERSQKSGEEAHKRKQTHSHVHINIQMLSLFCNAGKPHTLVSQAIGSSQAEAAAGVSSQGKGTSLMVPVMMKVCVCVYASLYVCLKV